MFSSDQFLNYIPKRVVDNNEGNTMHSLYSSELCFIRSYFELLKELEPSSVRS